MGCLSTTRSQPPYSFLGVSGDSGLFLVALRLHRPRRLHTTHGGGGGDKKSASNNSLPADATEWRRYADPQIGWNSAESYSPGATLEVRWQVSQETS